MVRVLGFEITRLKKAYTSGGGEQYSAPTPWQTAMLGPGTPIYPVTPAQDTELPRSIDYPISINSQLTPRSGYGILPFGILSSAYEKIPECRNPVLLIHRQLSSFLPRLVDKKNNVVNDHPMKWMCEYPDGVTPFSVWMTRYIKSTKIYDAPALYFERNRGNEITGLHFIDGSTLFIILDEWGNTPKPESVEDYVRRQSYSYSERESQPSVPGSVAGPTTLNSFVEYYNRRLQQGKPVPAKVPAYTQVIKGTPFAWWSADDIWYMPESKRVNSPYGEPFIEAAWVWVNIIVNLVTFELAHYRTGNMPEGFVTLPRDWLASPDQVEALERAYNARMSNNPATERNRLRFFPDGSKYIPTKRNAWEEELYNRANQVIRDAIGVPSAETGDLPGQGLGGKGVKEANTTELNRNTMNPNRNTIMTPFNFALRNNGVDDVTFSLDAPVSEIDPDKLKASVYEGMTRGTYTLNDALAQLNMQPVGDPNDKDNIANKHLIIAGPGIYIVEDMEVDNGMAVPSSFGPDQAGGQPAGPETAMGNPEHTPEDQQTLQQFIKRVERGEPVGGKKYFLMKYNEHHDDKGRFAEGDGGGGGAGPRDPDATATAPKEEKKPFVAPPKPPKKAEGPVRNDAGPFHIEDAKEAQDPNPVMMEVETKSAAKGAGLEKHCGVCPEDDEYYGAPISREVTFNFPKNNHANDVEVVAMAPVGLEPKAALWKPEGGENDDLAEWIGGRQFVREEAAYLIDRSLGFMLVPVAYVSESYGEQGAAVYYSFDMGESLPAEQYGQMWIERAGVLDYVLGQHDRGYAHNYRTHPDDGTRMILFDNGLCLSPKPSSYCKSPFTDLIRGKQISDETLLSVKRCFNDASTWIDVVDLVGLEAVTACKMRMSQLILLGEISESSSTQARNSALSPV